MNYKLISVITTTLIILLFKQPLVFAGTSSIIELPSSWNTNYDKSVSLKYSKSEIEIDGLTYELKIPKYNSSIKTPCSGRIHKSTSITSHIECSGTFNNQGNEIPVIFNLEFVLNDTGNWVVNYTQIFDSRVRDWVSTTTTPQFLTGTTGINNTYPSLIIDGGGIKITLSNVVLFVDLSNSYSVITNTGESVLKLLPGYTSIFLFGLSKTTLLTDKRNFIPVTEYKLVIDYFKNNNNADYDSVNYPLFGVSSIANFYELELRGNWFTSDSVRISAVTPDDLRPISEGYFNVFVTAPSGYSTFENTNLVNGYSVKIIDYIGISPVVYNTSEYGYGGSLGKKIDCSSIGVNDMEYLPDNKKIIRTCFDSNITFNNSVGNTIISYTSKDMVGKWCFDSINIKRATEWNGNPITLDLDTEIPFDRSCSNNVFLPYTQAFTGRETPYNNNVYLDRATKRKYYISLEGFYVKPYLTLSESDINKDNSFNLNDIIELLKRLFK